MAVKTHKFSTFISTPEFEKIRKGASHGEFYCKYERDVSSGVVTFKTQNPKQLIEQLEKLKVRFGKSPADALNIPEWLRGRKTR